MTGPVRMYGSSFRLLTALVVAGLAVACNPNTRRPALTPLPEALAVELELSMAAAVEIAAEALRIDSIPVTVVYARDGYLETGWFEAGTGTSTRARPVGRDIVRLRGWATPGRVGHTDLVLELVYRPGVDPSRPGRDLERAVPEGHPAAVRLEAAIRKMVEQFGGDHNPFMTPVPPAARPDTAVRPDTVVRPDTTVRPRPDTLRSGFDPGTLLRSRTP